MAADTTPRRGIAGLVTTVMLAIFTGVGLLSTVAVAIDWLQGLRTYYWQETTCTIESSEVVERPEYGDHLFSVAYRYVHRLEEYQGDGYRPAYDGSDDVAEAERLAFTYAEGRVVRCWVDPDEPGASYLRRGSILRGLWIFVPLVFVAVGGGMLWLVHGAGGGLAGLTSEDESGTRKLAPPTVTTLMIILFGGFFVIGAGLLVPFFLWPSWQVVQARSWTEVSCEIIESGVRTHQGEDGATYSVEALYRYEIDGREIRGNRYRFLQGSSGGYESKAATAARIPAGSTTTCYVNPDDPFDAVVDRGFSPEYLFGLVPALFTLVGLVGLGFVYVSARGVAREVSGPAWVSSRIASGVEAGSRTASRYAARMAAEHAASSGPIALEPVTGRVAKLAGLVGVTIFWNGIVALFCIPLVQSWRAGDLDWFLAIVISPFALIGVLMIASVPLSVLALVNPRPHVRLSRSAIPAGGDATVEWAFDGAVRRIQRVRIWLEATRLGVAADDDAGSRIGPIRTVAIVDRSAGHGANFGTASIAVPGDADPSHDGFPQVRWTLKLHGAITFWPDVHEEYEIRVLPASGSGPSTASGSGPSTD